MYVVDMLQFSQLQYIVFITCAFAGNYYGTPRPLSSNLPRKTDGSIDNESTIPTNGNDEVALSTGSPASLLPLQSIAEESYISRLNEQKLVFVFRRQLLNCIGYGTLCVIYIKILLICMTISIVVVYLL